MQTTIAITGGAGKTGRVVCRHFLKHGYDIRPVDSLGLARGGRGQRGNRAPCGCRNVHVESDYAAVPATKRLRPSPLGRVG